MVVNQLRYECQISNYLTDKQWQVIEKVINPQERTRKHSLRDIMNAILYINKTGCQWRLLPRQAVGKHTS